MPECNWNRRGDTADPATVLERKESRTCKGCIHLSSAWDVPWCLKKKDTAKKKCSRYKEKD